VSGEVPVIVGQGKKVAARWMREEASFAPELCGAFFHGSINWLPDNAVLPAASDIDVMIVLDNPDPPIKLGKVRYGDVLLDVSYLARDQLRSPEQVLGQYHLAGSFRTPSVILDPSGHLTALQAAVARAYAQRRWVRRRCEHARDKVLSGYRLDQSAPFYDQVTAWLFPAGITTHVLLVAGLKNPTVRTRYVAAQRLLTEYGRSDFYEPLLDLLGCAEMNRARVEHHLAALTDAFDAAKAVIRTPFFFASDISDVARPLAIDGSRELIERGQHREAVFWIVATYARCLKVFGHDAPELTDTFEDGFRQLVGDLGITSSADLHRRTDQVQRFLPRVWDVAEAIMADNREIED
jgi:hypothetical protein